MAQFAFMNGFMKSSAYIYLIFESFQFYKHKSSWTFIDNATTQNSLLFKQVLFCRSKTKSASVAFFFLSSLILSPRSLSLYKLRHEPTPGDRFPNLKSRSFSGPSQNLNNESVGPSSKTKQNKRNKETNKKHKKAVHFVW